ncbi:MAG TPA: hypothetical protein VFR81_26160 [Longimicrobium sp.]|nr:hypothetical protein [Longimicrobium sp.]
MNAPHRGIRAPGRLGREGIALPLALLGLVAVSLMVTAALLTSSTEVAVSGAHRDAATGLYNSNGALEQYVATRAAINPTAANPRLAEGPGTVVGPDGRTYSLRVGLLERESGSTGAGAATQMFMDETFSIVAAPPQGRGRSVGALVRSRRTLLNARFNVNAGFTSGGNVSIGGSSLVSNGATNQVACDSSAAPYSVEVTQGATINAGAKNVEGATKVSSTQKTQLMNQVFGSGITMETLAQSASIKFGPMFPGAPTWSNNKRPNDSFSTATSDSVYNWGCPAADIDTKKYNCTTAGKTRFVVVAIDASNLTGTEVVLNGDWGQGILMILNGSLRIQGNFVFRGILLVEKDLTVGGGTGQFEGKLEGTVVAFGENSTVTDEIRGNAVIRYNRCSINDAQNALNNRRLLDQPQVLQGRTFSWFELVR